MNDDLLDVMLIGGGLIVLAVIVIAENRTRRQANRLASSIVAGLSSHSLVERVEKLEKKIADKRGAPRDNGTGKA